MSIYTKTGDKGQTSLATGERVSKTDPRIETYGTADELNAYVGWLCAALDESSLPAIQLHWVQQRLFNLGAALSGAPGEWIGEADVLCLEQWIDRWQEELPPLRAFILPAGGEVVCRAHVCRTVTRRLERLMCALEECDPEWTKWVNRLSDYLFVLARVVAQQGGEKTQIWEKEAKV